MLSFSPQLAELPGGMMSQPNKDRSVGPIRHTAVVNDPYEMWSKLYWNIEQFQDLQRKAPKEKEPLGFAAIDVCIAATSLVDWVASAVSRRENTKCETEKAKLFLSFPAFKMFRAIANTSKHSNFREADWEDGAVEMAWWEADEDSPATWVLFHVHSEEQFVLAHQTFEQLKILAWRMLSESGLTEGLDMGPEWFQKKMGRIFPPRQATTDLQPERCDPPESDV